MRLLNVRNLEFRVFHRDIPKYVTASHTWSEGEETTIDDVRKQCNTHKMGYRKVEGFAKYTREQISGVDWIWIDTCCINQDSSQEVSEAINSMFEWYSNAEVCLAYLADTNDVHDWSHSSWFRRGWTLQELLVPRLVIFLTQDWQVIGHKGGKEYSRSGKQLRVGPSCEEIIADITGIHQTVLHDYGQSQGFTVDQRLAWTDGRETTRNEDMSYCLLGLFNVSMPVIYGEGATKARRRLLAEIHKVAILAGEQPAISANQRLNHVGTLPKSSSGGDWQRIGEHQSKDVDYHIPFDLKGIPVTNYFVARNEDMQHLEDFFQNKPQPARRSVFIVHGLGGVGKTQLCVEYVRKHKDDFSAILWLNGSSKDALRQSLADIALKLPTGPITAHRPSQEDLDIQKSIDSLLQWLSLRGNTNWLLVFDNVDRDWQTTPKDPQAYNFECFLPPADHGSILITSRITRLQRPKASLHLRSVNSLLGREILEVRAGKKLPNAESLLEKLGGLPLALVQAGAYLRETNMSVQKYLKFYNETWATLMNLQNQFPLHEYAEQGMLTTWKMSYDQVCKVDTQAARLLDLWAFLYNGDVWYELVALSPEIIEQTTRSEHITIATDELSFRHSLNILSQYSLIQANPNDEFSIHPVVHAWCLQNITSAETRQLLCDYALISVVIMVPSSMENSYWEVARRLLPHARATAVRCLDIPMIYMHAEPLNKIADFISNWESSTEVEKLYLRVLEQKEKALGPEHTSTLNTINNLGNLYSDQGKLAEAEEMYIRALKGKEKALGPEHTSTLNTINNLGTLYSDQGKLAEAEEMYIRALKGLEKALGPEHTSTLNTVIGLGILYLVQGKLAEAREMFMRALNGFEKAERSHEAPTSLLQNMRALLKLAQTPVSSPVDPSLSDSEHQGRSLKSRGPRSYVDSYETNEAGLAGVILPRGFRLFRTTAGLYSLSQT